MFGAAISFYFSAAWMSWFVVPIAAFCGAAFVTYLIYLLSSQWQYQSTDRLLLAGLAFNAFFAALTSLVVSLLLEDYQKIGGIFHWLFGGFSGRTMNHFYMGFVPIFAGFVLARKVLPRLNVLSLGEEIASTLAVDTIQLRRFTILSIALLVGASISVAGAIPFVGLVIPHITRQLLGPEHRQLALYSTLNGMSLTLMADLLARTLRSPLELEVGLITSILGAPFFLSLLLRKKD
jgi:iron complex transport system permease protein